jgi:hypothetical protein
MSFVPNPTQSNASNNSNKVSGAAAAVPAAAAAPDTTANAITDDEDLLFKIRTFDVYWVEKKALMYKDGYAKVCVLRRLSVFC